MSFLDRLKERKVVQWALAYVAAAAVLLELLGPVVEGWGLSPAVVRTLVLLLALGFLVTVVLAWYHGEPGRQRPGRTELLVLALILAGGAGAVALARGSDGADEASLPTGLEEPSRRISLNVLPPDPVRRDDELPDWAPLVQHLFATELSSRRGLAVTDPLSLNSRLERDSAGEQGAAGAGMENTDYLVKTTVSGAADEARISYYLTFAGTGEVLLSGSVQIADESDLPTRIREAAEEILTYLEEATGGISKALDTSPWLARPPTNVEAHRAFIQGMEYSYRGLPGGREYFERAVELAPEFIGPRIWLVSSLVSAGEVEEAREHVQALHALEDEATPFEQAMIGWADAVASGDMEGRVRHLRVALGYSPGNNVLTYSLGAGLASLGRFDEAEEILRPLIEARWQHSRAYVAWGMAVIQTEHVEGLRETLESALSITPQSRYIHGLLEAVALFEGDPAAATRYGSLYRRRFTESEMEQAYREVIPAFQALAELAAEQGRAETRRRLLRRALDAVPSHQAVRLQLALALLEEGRESAAEEHYLRVRETHPDQPELIQRLGEMALLLDRRAEAEGHFRRYLEIAPQGPHAIEARERLRDLESQ